jgi:hypothetical protein
MAVEACAAKIVGAVESVFDGQGVCGDDQKAKVPIRVVSVRAEEES